MTAIAHDPRLTRRQLISAGAGLAVVGAGAVAGSELLGHGVDATLEGSVSGLGAPVRAFRSRPDLKPTAVGTWGRSTSRGYILINTSWSGGSQVGPMIIDNDGEPVWFKPLSTGLLATNLNMQTYRGGEVLTWWEGGLVHYYGQGEAVIADHSYRELVRVRAVAGRKVDLHEFVLTPDGTALFTCYPQMVKLDLSSIGGARDTTVIESIFQEVDIRTGRLLLEWRSLDHIPPEESREPPSDPYDYLHLNSIRVAADGNLLVSGRGTWTVYKLDRRTGAIIWRLGGKWSDFAMQRGAQFAFQHHVVPVTRDVLSIFDNGSDGSGSDDAHSPEDQSRGILVKFDEARRSARLERTYKPPHSFLAGAMGSVHLGQQRVLVGWGLGAFISEYALDGRMLWDAKLLSKGANTYRAFRVPWHGLPHDLPAAALARDRQTGERTVYVSWNGATEVRYWRVLRGAAPDKLAAVGIAPRRGFETAIPLGTAGGYVAVRALDGGGSSLATSLPVKV